MITLRAKQYTLGEEIVNAVTHGLGAIFCVIGSIVMLIISIPQGGVYIASAIVYSAGLILLYTMSTLYHAISHSTAKHVLQAFDHSTIFLLIAGTYTPYALITLKGTMGWIVFGVVFSIGIFGVVLNIISVERFKTLSLILYVVSGLTVVIAAKPICESLAPKGLLLMALGGVFYLTGIIFYKMKSKKYFHGIWHLFVLGGSVSHYFSIVLYVLR